MMAQDAERPCSTASLAHASARAITTAIVPRGDPILAIPNPDRRCRRSGRGECCAGTLMPEYITYGGTRGKASDRMLDKISDQMARRDAVLLIVRVWCGVNQQPELLREIERALLD
jgi:hypothetical protein